MYYIDILNVNELAEPEQTVLTIFDTSSGWQIPVSEEGLTVTIKAKNLDSNITQEQLNMLVEKGLIYGINRKEVAKTVWKKPSNQSDITADDLAGLFRPVVCQYQPEE